MLPHSSSMFPGYPRLIYLTFIPRTHHQNQTMDIGVQTGVYCYMFLTKNEVVGISTQS